MVQSTEGSLDLEPEGSGLNLNSYLLASCLSLSKSVSLSGSHFYRLSVGEIGMIISLQGFL